MNHPPPKCHTNVFVSDNEFKLVMTNSHFSFFSSKTFVFQINQSLTSTEERNPAISWFQQGSQKVWKTSLMHSWTVSVRHFSQREWQRTWITEKPVWSGSDHCSPATSLSICAEHIWASPPFLLTIFCFPWKPWDHLISQRSVVSSSRPLDGVQSVSSPCSFQGNPSDFPTSFNKKKRLVSCRAVSSRSLRITPMWASISDLIREHLLLSGITFLAARSGLLFFRNHRRQ